ncbi:PTS system mannose-specific EIIBCA component [Pseudovibrio axinellae]|uniref:PTS system mannose-specific EIIBCA component n=1 Tax=Pseudovibrio axinellae TaxID=989403 RepID=A0A165VZW3_9HYPH|nr:PTS fructose transporter subunit EIIC [Pseudovibrio axinellae]KZL15731.1 PTS system mannose-specific EIIBCA component [Pseudovibrio axinellae]SER80972.1 PTS system unknown substrate IIC component, Fru family [Pseudovibrio axinellae]
MNDLIMIFRNTRQHLMTGVSYMIPFVVAGGILLAASVMIYGEGAVPTEGTWLHDLFMIGVTGFQLMVPILAAYIGYSIADRSALAPAAIGAFIGANMYNTGFFGAIFAGLLAGIVVHYLKKIKVPSFARSIMPIFVIPIIGTFITAGAIVWGIGEPIGLATASLTEFLKGMQDSSIVLLAIVMGFMLAFDMGGPVNKVAYAFVILCVGEGIYNVAAISAVGVAVPSVGMGLATVLNKKLYEPSEREAGRASFLMGTMGITEGAIPFAAADPLRVLPSIMIGTAAGTVTAALLGVECFAAWGGLIVLPVVEGRFGFIIALAVGSIVTAVLVNTLKSMRKDKAKEDKSVDDSDLDIQFG